jgi:glyoxylase-like metal-dependent hydrolase (beta-lactamase superfamily II)
MARESQEVVPGVFVVGGPDLTGPADCLVYAVDGGTEAALIDCGAGKSAREILANLERVGLGGKPLSTLILTHCHVDHIGGLAYIVRERSPKVVCHAWDLDAIQTGDPKRTASSWYGVRLPAIRVDHVLRADEEFILVGQARLRCLHTPGHTPGSISVLWESDSGKILFGQDIHGPFMGDFGSDIERWAASMGKLLDLRPDVLCEGHYGIFQPWKEVERFIRDHLRQHGF